MAASTTWSFSPAITSLPLSAFTPRRPINSLPCPCSFRPTSVSKPNSSLELSRLRIAQGAKLSSKRSYRVVAVFGSDSGTYPEEESNDSITDAGVDIKLPRRSLLVQFTCGECGERTERLINRLAYERGLVYVQCAGCLRYHKLADNLGLVVEYDLRDEL